MAKYRVLTTDELDQLEQIFINFLAANSITAQDWEKIKSSDIDKMNSLINEFSDVVFEKTLSNVTLLEKRLSDKILMYKITDEGIILEGLEVIGNNPLDFRLEFNLTELNNLFSNPDLDISFIEGTKPFFEDKNKEVFDLMESGAMISQNDALYDAFKLLKKDYSIEEE